MGARLPCWVPTGPRDGELDEIGWYCGNSHERIHDVGGERPNSWWYDMLGNVWDGCWVDEHWS